MATGVMMMTVYKRLFKNKVRWGVDVSVPDGRRIRKIVGSKKDAEKVETKLKAEILEGKWQLRFLPQLKLNTYLKKYLRYIKDEHAKSTYERTDRRIKKHIKPYFGRLDLANISKQRIDNYKAMRRKQGAKPNTIRLELACLSHMFKMAINWKYLFVNPMKGIEKPRIAKQPPRFLMDDEADRLLKACSPYLYPIVLCALHTGMRKSELLNLRWVDVDFKRRQIVIRSNSGYHTKNYDYRYVGINSTLYRVLSVLPKLCEYVFTYRGQRIKDVKKALQAAYKKAKLNYGGLHILRHTFATNLIKKGTELEKIQQLLGHKHFSTTLQYAHLTSRSVKDEVNKLDDKED
jgi:integrase